MTSPQPPIIIQQPGVGDIARRALDPLLQGLQRLQQRKLQEQQLALQQQQVESQNALRQQQTAALQLQSEKATREAKGMADATKIFQETVEAGQEFNKETITGILAKLKSPEAITAFVAMVPDIGQALATPAAVEQTGAEARTAIAGADVAEAQAPTLIQQAELDQKAIQKATDFLSNPNAKLPDDPTVGQATAARTLGILGFMSSQLASRAQTAQADAQTRMFARQTAVDVMRQSIREFNEQLEAIGEPAEMQRLIKEGEAFSLESILDRNARAIIGVSGAELRKTVGDAFREFQRKDPSKPVDVGTGDPSGIVVMSPDQEAATRQIVQGRGFQALPPDERRAVLEGAMRIAAGESRLPEKGEASDKIINLMAALVRKLRSAQ